MAQDPHPHEADARMTEHGLLSPVEPALNGTDWMGHLEWGPGHMRNDMGPATVIVTPEEYHRQAAAATVQRAVERAIDQGEESPYDE